MESKLSVPIRLAVYLLTVVSLVLCSVASVLWASTCAGYFIEWRWSTADYQGIALETTNGDFIARGPTEFWEPRPQQWETRKDEETLAEFHTRFELMNYISSRGIHCRVMIIPWWWLVLATAILPTWRASRARLRPIGVLAKLAGISAVPALIILSVIPRTADAASFFSSHDEIRRGWPFAVYSSIPVDDGTRWGRWAAGGLAADVLAAIILTVATVWVVQLGITAVRSLTVRQRLRGGLCSNCSYDLTGNTSGVCPECGRHSVATNFLSGQCPAEPAGTEEMIDELPER